MKKIKMTSTRGTIVAVTCIIIACLSITNALIVTQPERPTFSQALHNFDVDIRTSMANGECDTWAMFTVYGGLGWKAEAMTKKQRIEEYNRLESKYNDGNKLTNKELFFACILLLFLSL